MLKCMKFLVKNPEEMRLPNSKSPLTKNENDLYVEIEYHRNIPIHVPIVMIERMFST